MQWKTEKINLAGACDACLVDLKYFVQPQYTGIENVWIYSVRVQFSTGHSRQQSCEQWERGDAVCGRAAPLSPPPCLISSTSYLHIDRSPEVQLHKHHLPGMQVHSRKGVKRYEVESAAVGPWQLKSNCLSWKQLEAASRSDPQEKPDIVITISRKSVFTWIPHCTISNPLSSQVPGYIPAMCILCIFFFFITHPQVLYQAALCSWEPFSTLRPVFFH